MSTDTTTPLSINAVIALFSPPRQKCRTLPQVTEAMERTAESCSTSPIAAAFVAEHWPQPGNRFRTLSLGCEALQDVHNRLAALGYKPAASSTPPAPSVTIAATLPAKPVSVAPTVPAVTVPTNGKSSLTGAALVEHYRKLPAAARGLFLHFNKDALIAANTMTRVAFSALNSREKSKFSLAGGKLID